jgi:hypothetical protein
MSGMKAVQCRTDGTTDVIAEMPFFRFPHLGQWGPPKFKSYVIIPVIDAMFASMIEFVGDYYGQLCASLDSTFVNCRYHEVSNATVFHEDSVCLSLQPRLNLSLSVINRTPS